jgi:hypothetical protein
MHILLRDATSMACSCEHLVYDRRFRNRFLKLSRNYRRSSFPLDLALYDI